MSLRTEVFGLLDNTLQLCRECPDAGELSQSLKEMRTRLETPLRVAVVGIMKAGKSTFMNALMGVDILYTGSLETTYTVCWFRYGKTPRLTVCFRDGEELDAPFEDLKKWSVREYEAENPRINDVKYLIIHYPAEVLKTLEFIDTPGLNSVYGTDAQNTLDFLSIKGSEDTIQEAGLADAVIYAFSHTASGFDQEILRAFHDGADAASPINSVGLLTKVDATGIWNLLDGNTPVEAARAVTGTVMQNAEMKRLLFTVLPVCAKVCEGYAQLEEQDWQALTRISEVKQEDLQDMLFDAELFATCEEDFFACAGNAYSRRRLIGLVGQYGILEIAQLLREGRSREEIGAQLQARCGIQAVRELLYRHFGNRTCLIKTRYIFNHLRGLIHRIKRDPAASAHLKEIGGQLAEGIEGLMTSVQTLKELKALQMYYNGQLRFLDEEERQDFLRITGEYGRSAEERLGVEGSLPVSELTALVQKKISQWHGKSGNWMMPGSYVEAASILARSYEKMYYHLNALSEE